LQNSNLKLFYTITYTISGGTADLTDHFYSRYATQYVFINSCFFFLRVLASSRENLSSNNPPLALLHPRNINVALLLPLLIILIDLFVNAVIIPLSVA